ncbi:hypothetical protein, partial [Anoxybacteroides rupiense]|uniref:hypothetical protein n=1 Tax=Anoxybacteroides rupiense TaxID=311460 RepID=UPI00366CB22E
ECCAGTFILQDRTIFLCTFLKNEKNERGFKKSVTLTFWTAPLLSVLQRWLMMIGMPTMFSLKPFLANHV